MNPLRICSRGQMPRAAKLKNSSARGLNYKFTSLQQAAEGKFPSDGFINLSVLMNLLNFSGVKIKNLLEIFVNNFFVLKTMEFPEAFNRLDVRRDQ